MRRWHGIPHPCLLPGLASVLCLLMALSIAHSFTQIDVIAQRPPGSWVLGPAGVWVLVWGACAIGLWLERNWARTLLLLEVQAVDAETAADTAHILLKYRSDIDKALKEFSSSDAFETA